MPQQRKLRGISLCGALAYPWNTLGSKTLPSAVTQIQGFAGIGPVWRLGEWHQDVVHRFGAVAVHHCQNKLVFLVQAVVDLVAGDRDSALALRAALTSIYRPSAKPWGCSKR